MAPVKFFIGASLCLTGSDVATDNNLTLEVADLPPNALGYFLVSQDAFTVPNPGGSEGDLPYYRAYRMGGLRNLTGIADGSLRGGAFAMGGAGVLYHIAGLELPYAAQWYLGGWVDVGNAWEQAEQATWRDTYTGGAATLLIETPIGPFETGYGYSSMDRGTFYLQLGIHFAQPFNP